MYCVNSKYFTGLYRNKFSGYAEWREDGLDCGVYFNSANIGPYMSLDETCLSNGEVWTLLTNKDGHGGRGTLAAAFPGTKSDEIITTLIGAMGKTLRRKVKEVTCDLSRSMMLIAAEVFYNAHVVNDRFHVQQLYNEAVDEIRVDILRQLIAEIMLNLGYVNRFGSGINTVSTLLEENKSNPAEFLLGDYTTFKVVVQNADVIENGTNVIDKKPNIIVNVTENGTDGTDNGTDGTDNGTDGTNEMSREDAIVNLMRKNKRISIKEISAQLNIPRRTLFRIIDALKTSNRIKRIGSEKSGTWEVIE
ncbi:MAG: transposase [Paramuribaculum sp.]|jgi:hypothetical protein